jgi:hypothetical protein
MAFNKLRKSYVVEDVFAEMDATLVVVERNTSDKEKELKEMRENNSKLVQDMYNLVNPNWDEEYQDYKSYVEEARKNITSIEEGVKERIKKIEEKQKYIKYQDELIKKASEKHAEALAESGKVYFNSTQIALEEQLMNQEKDLENRYQKTLEKVEFYTKEEVEMDAFTAELFGDL